MFRHWFRTLISYLRLPLIAHADRELHDLREEIEFHLSSSATDHHSEGMDPRQSQQTALEQFGDVKAVVEDCCDVSLSRHLFWHRLHQLLTLGLVVAMAWLIWIYFPSENQPPSISTQLAASGYLESETTGDIKGTVVAEDGQPLSDTHILAVVKTWPPHGFRQNSFTAVTRPDGTFLIENVYPPGQEYEVQIAAIADAHLLKSAYISMRTGTLEPLHFQLTKSAAMVLHFESNAGTPLAGVSAFPFERTDQSGQEHCIYFCSAQPVVRQSNQEGNLSMPHFLPGEQVTVYIQFPGDEWQTRELTVPTDNQAVILTPEPSSRLNDG